MGKSPEGRAVTAKRQGMEGHTGTAGGLGPAELQCHVSRSMSTAVPELGRTIWVHQKPLAVAGDVAGVQWRPGDERGAGREGRGGVTGRGQSGGGGGGRRAPARPSPRTCPGPEVELLPAIRWNEEPVQDLLVLGVFLMSKLVAGKAEQHQAPGPRRH